MKSQMEKLKKELEKEDLIYRRTQIKFLKDLANRHLLDSKIISECNKAIKFYKTGEIE